MESGNIQSAGCAASLVRHGYGCWQHPFRGTQIQMNPTPLQQLSNEALRQIKAKPPSEIGGILWGSLLADSVIIEDAELVLSGGPLYNSTQSDTRNLELAIKRNRTDGLELVGYFRTHIRDGLCLSPQDQDLITKHLCRPEQIFLLIRPFEMGICMAAFFFWQNGRLQTDGSDLEVPFLAIEQHPSAGNGNAGDQTEQSNLRKDQERPPDREATPRRANADERLASHGSPQSSQPSAPLSRSMERSWVLLISFSVLVAVAAAVGTTAYFTFPLLKSHVLGLAGPAMPNPEVGLKVARAADGRLDLTWNRSALGQARAQYGLLTIADGSRSKQLTIDSAQLHSGTLTYFPNGADIQFRLEIGLGGGRSVAESVRVILPEVNATNAHVALSPQPIIPTHASDRAKPPMAFPNPGSAPPLRSGRAPFKVPRYIPPREIIAAHTARERPRAPDLQVDPALSPYAAFPSSLLVLHAPPPRLTVPTPSPATPIDVIPTKSGVSKPGSVTPSISSAATYTPPRPLRQVMPVSNLAGFGLKSQTGRVEVQVTVDESGHVKNLRLVSNREEANSLIANAVIAAARQWIFQPATLHGKAIATEERIVFDFRSENH